MKASELPGVRCCMSGRSGRIAAIAELAIRALRDLCLGIVSGRLGG
jgi:hypothetical protein